MAKYDIFISYRREGGYDTAKHLYDLLSRDGYKVSFDIDTLRNGDFDTSLLNRIDECKDFILIVDAHAFDRTLNPQFNPQNDWLRQELAYALKKGKNVIPIFLNGIKGFPNDLPSDIKGVSKKNGPQYNRYYFNDFYVKLKKNFLISKSRKDIAHWFFLIILIFIVLLVSVYYLKKDYSIFKSETYKNANQYRIKETKIDSESDEDIINGRNIEDLIEEYTDQVEKHNNAWWTVLSNNPYLTPLTTEFENTPDDDEFHLYSNRMQYKGKLMMNGVIFSQSHTGSEGITTISLYGPNAGPSLMTIYSDYPMNDDLKVEDIGSYLSYQLKSIIKGETGYGDEIYIFERQNMILIIRNSVGSGGVFPELILTTLDDLKNGSKCKDAFSQKILTQLNN